MNGARHELFARAALAGDEHREVVPLQALDLFHHAHHGGAGAQEARKQRLERLLVDDFRRRRGALARGAEVEALSGDGGDHLEAALKSVGDRPEGEHGGIPRAVVIAADAAR